MQYTIEARELTSGSHRPPFDVQPRRTTIEAKDADEAISHFVEDEQSVLLSLISPKGRESIATVKKEDSMYLVRVYTA